MTLFVVFAWSIRNRCVRLICASPGVAGWTVPERQERTREGREGKEREGKLTYEVRAMDIRRRGKAETPPFPPSRHVVYMYIIYEARDLQCGITLGEHRSTSDPSRTQSGDEPDATEQNGIQSHTARCSRMQLGTARYIRIQQTATGTFSPKPVNAFLPTRSNPRIEKGYTWWWWALDRDHRKRANRSMYLDLSFVIHEYDVFTEAHVFPVSREGSQSLVERVPGGIHHVVIDRADLFPERGRRW